MRIQHTRRAAIPGLALAAFTAATLAGCTGAQQPASSPETPDVTDAADEPPTDHTDDLTGAFATRAVEYPDGIHIALSEPDQFNPTSSAATTDDAPFYVKFTVSITNGTDENFDPGPVNVTVLSGEREGVPVFDVVNGLSITPTTTIRPGKASSWVAAFGVTDPKDLTADVELNDFIHDPALFVTEAE